MIQVIVARLHSFRGRRTRKDFLRGGTSFGRIDPIGRGVPADCLIIDSDWVGTSLSLSSVHKPNTEGYKN
jgi:hypothetical protein